MLLGVDTLRNRRDSHIKYKMKPIITNLLYILQQKYPSNSSSSIKMLSNSEIRRPNKNSSGQERTIHQLMLSQRAGRDEIITKSPNEAVTGFSY